MAIHLTQITIGASATACASARTICVQATVESDDGNSNPAFLGDSTVTSANGIRLQNSATVPGRIQFGPYTTSGSFDLKNLFVAGTQNEKVNILYVTQ